MRIIPAYAGSTSSPASPTPNAPDHPRIRGEHILPSAMCAMATGSSPHTRGAPPLTDLKPMGGGDHPRIRGEHLRIANQIGGASGSSPHTRGAHMQSNGYHGEKRIIPAYAGSTVAAPRASAIRQDHPRIRGEHPIAAKPDNLVMGSSPHTRGARERCEADVAGAGIIPAYAGSTRFKGLICDFCTDHPRIRGEHASGGGAARSIPGSSPHTRGARLSCRR